MKRISTRFFSKKILKSLIELFKITPKPKLKFNLVNKNPFDYQYKAKIVFSLHIKLKSKR